jgi:Na+-transporting methylmalonyl-CoA/oxaloacetate decarboxylase gamma subunit
MEANLKDLSFGLTMTFVGMGVTLLTLCLLILVILLMNKIFPHKHKEGKKD